MKTKKNFIKKRNSGLFISYTELRKYRKSTFGLYAFEISYHFTKLRYNTVRLKWSKERYVHVVGGNEIC